MLSETDLRIFNLGDFSLDQLKLNSSILRDLYPIVSEEFSLGDYYLNYSNNELFTAKNLTTLEDFEEFDARDMMNVIAYAIMSAGTVECLILV